METVNRLTPIYIKLLVSLLTTMFLSGIVFGQYYRIDIKRDSARTDKRTGGIIEKADFTSGESDLRLTLNVPAFTMTLWQNDKEVKNYQVGVGMKSHPIYVGRREIKHIIFNPVWIPPNSEWVSPKMRGKIIRPTDPRNPLGKVKMPLGYGYLLHEAKGTQDLGNLVSHGCVRVLRKDLYDISAKVVSAHSLPVSDSDVARAKRTKKTFVIELENTFPIEITYDTLVVEAGKLHIYPDVYSFKKNTVKNLRLELKNNDVDTSGVSDETLETVLSKAKAKTQYIVSLDELRNGNYLEGKVAPVLVLPKKKKRKSRRRKR